MVHTEGAKLRVEKIEELLEVESRTEQSPTMNDMKHTDTQESSMKRIDQTNGIENIRK